jgi:hypothetical protein
MSHEAGIDSPRIRFAFHRFVNPIRTQVEALLDRLVAAGRIRPVPYTTLHYLAVQGGGALYASPVEAALLGVPDPPPPAFVSQHAQEVADIIITGISIHRPDTQHTSKPL